MKFFLVTGEYSQPFEELSELGDLIDEHRTFVERAYEKGDFLLSGPQSPPDSGILIARARSHGELDRLLAEEPLIREKKVRVSRIVEFKPTKYRTGLDEWFS